MYLIINKYKFEKVNDRIKIRQQINNLKGDKDNIHDTSAIIVIVICFIPGCCFLVPLIFTIVGW